MPKTAKIEVEKRIRAVMEWILEDWPTVDIINYSTTSWGIEPRQAKRYIAQARLRWTLQPDVVIEQKRKLKIETLKKLKRSLREKFRGSPTGIQTILMVEKELIALEGLQPVRKIELTGKDGQPIQTENLTGMIDYSKLSESALREIVNAKRKQIEEN